MRKISRRGAFLLLVALTASVLVSCEKADELNPPRVLHLELGSGDKGMALVGADLHVELDVEAGDRIDLITVGIVQRSDDSYSHTWQYEEIWDKFRGTRNTHVHEHIDIPYNAATGMYNFILTITDQNGTSVEVIRKLNIQAAMD